MRVYTGVKRSGNYFNGQQAWEYALGAEAMARQLLAADFEKDKLSIRVDHFKEKWATPVQKLSVEGGSVEMEIYDIQSRFNLNNLVSEGGAIDTSQVSILRGLLSNLGVRPIYADMAARWASYADDTDNIYGSDKFPYRAADTQFGSVSEMRQLKDIEMKEYRRLEPYVSTLPVPVSININTAPPQVLASFSDGSAKAIERINAFIDRRRELQNGYSSTDDFVQMLGLDEDDLDDQLGVSSEYFEVRVIVDYNGRKVWLVSVLFRDAQTGEISLVSRDNSRRFSLGNSGSANDSNGLTATPVNQGADNDAGQDDKGSEDDSDKESKDDK
jgi:general secretion pathway protein K